MHIDVAYSLGFCKPVPHFAFGSSGKAFETPGFGGSFGCADPDTGIGFAYVMNRLGFHLWSDPRELALRQALFATCWACVRRVDRTPATPGGILAMWACYSGWRSC